MPFGLCNAPETFERLMETVLRELSSEACLVYLDGVIIEVTYLGHVISAEGVKTDPEKVKAVVDWHRPETVHDLRNFLGLCTYYRRFVKTFSTVARSLHKLTEAKSNFNWTEECEKSFNSLKQALTSSPILTYPRTDKDFILDTDASNDAILKHWKRGTCHRLLQKEFGQARKKLLCHTQRLLAIVKSIEH
ncbi:Retrovirus-related Pol polyprotein from transposon opus [Araneus ventricosus]|uniref:RNA-directed DNA polymerase n=1 Tax=Araneus ventricosus TaxID=182803 RepID=A0A4Y2MUF4_ARAVE|nr:Retrovirus-related Pol polyprotein from transposon opus [Araneus ventricosus]